MQVNGERAGDPPVPLRSPLAVWVILGAGAPEVLRRYVRYGGNGDAGVGTCGNVDLG
jgi:hypothetical protein